MNILFLFFLFFGLNVSKNIFTSSFDIEAPRCHNTAHTFLYTRPISDYIFLTRTLTRNIDYKKSPLQSDISIIPLYEPSRTLDKTTQYFFGRERNFLSVVGDDNIESQARDIRAEWLGLSNDFWGIFTIKPQQKQAGFLIHYLQELSRFTDISFLENWYIRGELSLYHVSNNIHFQSDSLLAQETLLAAFNNPSWDFARFKNGGQKKTGVGKIELALGTQYILDGLTLIYETIAAIPCGNKPSAKTIFNPVVGNGKFTEFGVRFSIDYEIFENNCPFHVDFFLDVQGLLFLKSKQWRTFDLKGKPLSRYLPFNKNTTLLRDTNIPGVNLLTRKVSVRPYLMADVAFGWSLYYKNFGFELGADIWGHNEERVQLLDCFVEDFGIAGTIPGSTSSFSDIAHQAPNDDFFVPVTIFDIDFASGRSGSALNYLFYGTAAYFKNNECKETILSGTFFYEIPQKRGALGKWGISLKAEMTL